MANHLMRQLRDAAKTALTGLTLNSVTITPLVNRSDDQALQDSELPAWRIRVREDQVVTASLGVSRLLERSAVLEVHGCQKKNATFEDDAYELCRLAEVALASLTGAKAVTIESISIEDDATGEKPVIVAKLSFKVVYIAAHGAPDVAF